MQKVTISIGDMSQMQKAKDILMQNRMVSEVSMVGNQLVAICDRSVDRRSLLEPLLGMNASLLQPTEF